jgi:hypothetical protein
MDAGARATWPIQAGTIEVGDVSGALSAGERRAAAAVFTREIGTPDALVQPGCHSVADDAGADTRCQPGPNRSVAAPLGKLDHGQRRGSAPAPEGKDLGMLSSTVLAIAGTGYGLIGLLVIIVLVLLIIRLV